MEEKKTQTIKQQRSKSPLCGYRKPEKWSNFFNMFLPEEISGVRLEELDGLYFLTCFKETIEFEKAF